MSRTLIAELADKKGEEVVVKGWIDGRRDHGKLVFLDLRDASSFKAGDGNAKQDFTHKTLVQSVALPQNAEAHSVAGTVRPEWVVEVRAKVNERPERMRTEEANGDIELELLEVKVLNEAVTPPFDVTSDGRELNEELRMAHRPLDLRRPRMQANIRNRAKVITALRSFLNEQAFTEIETPILGAPTPEGARDYLVPSRLQPAHFYALPQSPQQFKQLLMAGGLERYYQIARCMRDEDTRGDRQPEFTQLDIEMSFATKEEVMALNEQMIIETLTKLYPHKKIQTTPFPRLTYAEAMEKYGNDRPDLREDKDDPHLLAFCWVHKFPMFEPNEEGGSEWTFSHNPFSAVESEYEDDLIAKNNIGEIISQQYDLSLNGCEIGGGSVRSHRPEILEQVLHILGYSETEINEQFGHMVQSYKSGIPPHAGIAYGLDRLLMILQNEESIREVIAFPKTGEGRDLLFKAPTAVGASHLEELHLRAHLPPKQDGAI